MPKVEQIGSEGYVQPNLGSVDGNVQIDLSILSSMPEHVLRLTGVEQITLMDPSRQQSTFDRMKDWFNKNKDTIPQIGLLLEADRTDAAGLPLASVSDIPEEKRFLFGIELSAEITDLCDAILRDSASDPILRDRNVRFVFERTGTSTHDADRGYHADTRQIFWDGQGQRIGYDPVRSLPKYMVFIGRPGTLIIHGKIDPELTFQDSIELAQWYTVDADGTTVAQDGFKLPVISQLLPDDVYKVAAGELLHCPPQHEDGLLITASFNN